MSTAYLFDSTVLPALKYASETLAIRKQDEHAISVAQRGIERPMHGVTRLTQVREGLRSSELCRRSKIRDAVAWDKSSKISEEDPLDHTRDRDEWKRCWRSLDQIDDQRDDG
ncbi:unnamed protein product [Heligmosomoides polygyrus]|uniref:PINc domain-containing protein n=1 Tax=Heligmosomoides polygyrus TaxID=6339 RepID=A0A183GG08_HELPZ|nr:unnamed protein product [Heligmosomoides polygyrus]